MKENKIRYIVEDQFTYNGFQCVVVGHLAGHRCGYVAIPKSHDYYGKDYDDINVSVHGGLTYAGTSNSYPVKTEIPTYWIGFDCAHYMDGLDIELIKKISEINDDMDYYNRSIEFGGFLFEFEDEVRNSEYVKQEIKHLVNQL